ncbi:conserved protein of unknown function [Pseudodesulfovibrio profundus]|uniref:Ketoreductase domain-containing protein n=1 Tax=Pseudodesulfovibrio profundus TaxID=57320 RepID=A0A2C8FC49_9BACT|nr:SDR family NAD(P)-dependent oxidoreductase [Pseudodesulfovibrio profundus]SOB60063.1 conserved protein of unknown function [Pseudodesulfovibrio profundus]
MSPRHILITGATGGVGRALALEYAKPGVVLSLTGRSQEQLELLSALCIEAGAEVRATVLDIRDSEAVRQWVIAADDDQPVDLVFANAGVSSAIQSDGSGELFDDTMRLFEVNTIGSVATVHPLADRMRERGHGQIVLISSLSGLRGFPSTPAYSASKAAVRTYGKGLRGWLVKYGVKVNVVTMGFVESPMSERYVGAKPFSCSAGEAARKIRKGIERDRAEVIFPFILAVGIWSLGLLIEPVANWVLNKFFGCSVLPDNDSSLGNK